MKKAAIIILGLFVSFFFGFFVKSLIAKQPDNKATFKQPENNVNLKKVIGVAGVFFKCKDPDKIKEWYKTHLGFDTTESGTRFVWQEGSNPAIKGSLQWSSFAETEKYFDPSTKEFMINYRVENLVTLVEHLKKEGVTFIDNMETYDYGKFVHIVDIVGNKIELFEPNYEYGKSEKVENK